MEIDLRTDGPHNPDYTREVGNALAEAARVLNYATLPHQGCPGLEYPGDADSLIAALYTATQRLPQLFGQMSEFLKDQAETGTLADVQGRDANVQALAGAQDLREAAMVIATVTISLQEAQNAISGLYVKGDDDEPQA